MASCNTLGPRLLSRYFERLEKVHQLVDCRVLMSAIGWVMHV